jgi:hypothetical protein
MHTILAYGTNISAFKYYAYGLTIVPVTVRARLTVPRMSC